MQPQEDCTYEVFNVFKAITNAKAKYLSKPKILKIDNLKIEQPYILRINGKDMMSKVIYLTSKETIGTNIDLVKKVSSVNSYKESILYYNDMPQFMSIVMIQGYEDIKINGKKYNENYIGMRFTVNKTTTNFALNVKFRPYEDSSQLNQLQIDQLPFDYAKKYSLEITLKVT